MNDKIIELETRYSYQEELLHQLNETVISQQQQLDQQGRQLQLLNKQLQELRENLPTSEADETQQKPPHY